jgi:hypothetical protein
MLVKTYNYSKIYSFALSTIDLVCMLQNLSSTTKNYCNNANNFCIFNNINERHSLINYSVDANISYY